MNNLIKSAFAVIATILIAAVSYAAPKLPAPINHVNTVRAIGTITLAFSPRGGAEQKIVEEINKAQKSVFVQAYSFTNKAIGKALVDAHNRGVDVRCIADKSQEKGKYSLCGLMLANNIPMHIDDDFNIAHSKIMIIDDKTIITGSYNFSSSAENNNAENMLVIDGDIDLVNLYLINFNWRWDNTRVYEEAK